MSVEEKNEVHSFEREREREYNKNDHESNVKVSMGLRV